MRSGERVADVDVTKGRQLAHSEALALLLSRQMQLRLEEGQLLGEKADIVQQEHLAVLERTDSGAGRRPDDVVDERDGPPDQLGHHRSVRLSRGVVVVLEVTALMSKKHYPRAPLGEFGHCRGAALQTSRIAQPAVLAVERRVDIYPTEDDLSADLDVVQRGDAVLHDAPPAASQTALRPPSGRSSSAKTEIPVRQGDRFETIRLQRQRRAHGVHRLRDHDRLLRDVDGEHELAPARRNGLVEDSDLVHVGALVAEVTGVAEQRRVRVEAVGDPHDPDTGMCGEELERLRFRHLALERRDDVDDVTMRRGHMDEQAGGLDVRHDRHEVDCLMVRHGLDLGNVDQAAMRVAGVGNATDDGDDDPLAAHGAVETVDGPDQPGGVA